MEKINKQQNIKQSKLFTISSTIKIIKEYDKANQTKMQYSEMQYLLAHKKIKIYLIKNFIAQIYEEQYENINNNWKNVLKEEQIMKDFNKIKEKYVSEQWIEENASPQKIKQKEQKYKKYIQPLKNNEQIKLRVKMIKNEMKILQNKIIMTREQKQNINLIKQYNEFKDELLFLKNRNSKLKALKKQKQLTLPIKNINKINQISRQISQIQQYQNQIKHIQANRYTINDQLIQRNSIKNDSFIDKLNGLQKIFDFYSKKQVNCQHLFENITQNQKYISLENYLKLLSENGIDNLLSLDEKVILFKKQSKYSKKIDFLQFSNVLKAICQKQCQKLNIQFTSFNLQNFLNQVILKFKQKMKKLHSSLQNERQDNSLRTPLKSKYHFKLHSHTGKFQTDIQQQIKSRNQLKLPKAHLIGLQSSSMSHSKHPTKLSNSINYSKLKISQNKRSKFYTQTSSKGDDSSDRDVTYINAPVQISRITGVTSKHTYLDIFLKKKGNFNRIMKTQQYNQINSLQITPNFNILQLNNELKRIDIQRQSSVNADYVTNSQPKQSLKDNDLQDLIQQDEVDPFLTSHLSNKYCLNSSYVMKF